MVSQLSIILQLRNKPLFKREACVLYHEKDNGGRDIISACVLSLMIVPRWLPFTCLIFSDYLELFLNPIRGGSSEIKNNTLIYPATG